MARSAPVIAALATAADRARALNIFGSPCFVVDREVFWGDDRLDDSLAWARIGTLGPAASG